MSSQSTHSTHSTHSTESTRSTLSTYPVDDLLRRWERGDLTVEQAMGYLLQNVVMLSARLAEAGRAIRKLQQDLAAGK
jgi:hypothetical protein